MTEGAGINKTQIWVTVITVIGGLLTAIIVNGDKLFPREAETEDSPVQTQSEQTQSEQTQSEQTDPVATIDISGEWHSEDGSRFGFTQSGSSYEYTHTATNGTLQSTGNGTIEGGDLTHTFETQTGETGTCTAHVNAAADKITGNCVFEDGGWPFVIDR